LSIPRRKGFKRKRGSISEVSYVAARPRTPLSAGGNPQQNQPLTKVSHTIVRYAPFPNRLNWG